MSQKNKIHIESNLLFFKYRDIHIQLQFLHARSRVEGVTALGQYYQLHHWRKFQEPVIHLHQELYTEVHHLNLGNMNCRNRRFRFMMLRNFFFTN
jgi:hypothetical protein